jgi:hypothetical protein
VNQRWYYHKGKMDADRVAKLEAMGFDWGEEIERLAAPAALAGWDVRFDQLRAFKAERGDCRVPFGFKENRQLGKWVSKQRELFKKKKMKPDRIAKLKAIGFDWDLSPKPRRQSQP